LRQYFSVDGLPLAAFPDGYRPRRPPSRRRRHQRPFVPPAFIEGNASALSRFLIITPNERQAPRPPLNFTKQTDGAVQVWHRNAEATFARDGDAIRVVTRLGAEPRRQAILAVRIADDGNIVAVADGDELRSPAAAAEHVLTPVLVETFAKP
jgi:hypothetical protein